MRGAFRCHGIRCAIAVLAFVHLAAARAGAADSTRDADVIRGLGMLEYVAGDYAAGVDDHGRVRDAKECDEQIDFLRRAQDLLAAPLRAAAPRLLDELAALGTAARAHRPPEEVMPRLRALHPRIVTALHVTLTPRQVPSLATGRVLFAQACAACHGDDGRARTERARTLDHKPDDFHARAMDSRLSPYRAFTAVTFGVPGTPMASFETLDEAERWDLAFYVCALRHARPVVSAATTDAQPAAHVRLTLHDIALATDADLRKRAAKHSPAAVESTLASWRWTPPLSIGE